jgi:hypothetical protein
MGSFAQIAQIVLMLWAMLMWRLVGLRSYMATIGFAHLAKINSCKQMMHLAIDANFDPRP